LQGHSLWWTDGAPGVEPSMLMCAGMPRAERFTAMLDAR
jgi:type VI secretion system protein ImpM